MAVVFFGMRSVANTNSHGEHQTSWWTSSKRMSIRAVEREDTQIDQTQFVAESRIFSIALHDAIEILLENNYQKLTMTTVKTNKLRSL
jgi:hypothetical protein